MTIVIDVTCLLNTSFISGIQRVVIETILGLLSMENDILLLRYDSPKDEWFIVDNNQFVEVYKNGKPKKIIKYTEKFLEDFNNKILLDLDSTWSIDNKKRSILFPDIKAQGGKIVSYIYDIIPLDFPEYTDEKMLVDFIVYVAAILKNADVVLTETKSGVHSILNLCNQLGIENPKCISTWLGSDSINVAAKSVKSEKIANVLNKRYILMVGTLEPRKNHKLVLDAFDKKLFDEGLDLVFVGREGWNNDEFIDRVYKHPELGKKFHYFKGLSDDEVQKLYMNAYLLAFPSYAEGFGLPIIEAYQNGLPVIGANIDVTREVAGDIGVFFEQDNANDFIDKVESLVDNVEKYDKLKKQVSMFQNTTWQEMVAKIEEVLMNLSERN